MSDIKAAVKKFLDQEKVADIAFEGANIIVYCTDAAYALQNDDLIKRIVHSIKKRVEFRVDPELTLDQEESKNIIKEVGDEANIDKIIFDPQRSVVIIEAEKTKVLTRNRGELLDEIQQKTLWSPVVKRTPLIRSEIMENIRGVLYENSDYRRKFLNETGERIYNGWTKEKQEMWVRVSFLGGGRQVGRSCLLLQTPNSKILLDCGIDVASDDHAYPYLEVPEADLKDIDAVIVSHCHVDHVGLIPYLFKYGYRGPVYTTAPTRDIMCLLQLDTIKIHKSEGKPELYSADDVKEVVKHTITLDYKEVTDITSDVRLTLYNAGHALGSAMVHLNIGNGLHNFLYTGDIKVEDTRLLPGAHKKFRRLESMVLESTYGCSNCVTNSEDQDKKLSRIIKRTIQREGKVLMPTLGSGRGQEIIMMIVDLIESGQIPEIPIYVDGMVWDITAIYTAYPEFLNGKVRNRIFNQGKNPFMHPSITRVGSMKERKQIIEEGKPCVVLATSGMLVGGPSVTYLKGLGDDQRNSLVFSCYQGDGSLGRRIQGGERHLVFREGNKEDVLDLKLDIHRIEVSGHADRRELMNFVKHLKPRPRRIMVNHGDESRCLDLSSSLYKKYRMRTEAPRNLDVIRIV